MGDPATRILREVARRLTYATTLDYADAQRVVRDLYSTIEGVTFEWLTAASPKQILDAHFFLPLYRTSTLPTRLRDV